MKEKEIEILLKNNLMIKIRTNRIIERENRLELFDLDTNKMFFVKIDEIIYYTIKPLYR